MVNLERQTAGDAQAWLIGGQLAGTEGDGMNRRKFLSGTLTTAAAAVLSRSAPGAGAPAGGTRPRPNVLLLMADQHKRSCMGAYGDSVAITPNLDRLAAQSVRFTDGYCTNPVCTPSRASLMTGLYSHHLEAQDNSLPYAPGHRTMAHHFNRAGYLTALIGKMHWVDAQSHGFEYRLEFNDWFQYLGPKAGLYADELGQANSGSGLPEIESLWSEEGDPWKGNRTRDDRRGPVAVGRVSKLEEKDHFESFVARESVRFLKNYGKQDQPFFLISSFLKPHDPFMPAQRFADMFRAEEMKLPASWGKADLDNIPREVRRSIEFNGPTPEVSDPAEARKHIAYYYANLAQMDDSLGRVVRAVEELGLDRDTIICYTSDHGEMLGELGLWQKFQFYEGSCGVPLLIRVPGQQAGVCRTPVSLVSFSATIADLCGIEQTAPNDGESFADLVRNPASTAPHGPVFAEFALNTSHAKSMIRDGSLKYTYWTHDTPELYDLSRDAEELHNLAGGPAHAADLERLREKLFAWHRPDGA
jgi:choline-sulfatase